MELIQPVNYMHCFFKFHTLDASVLDPRRIQGSRKDVELDTAFHC